MIEIEVTPEDIEKASAAWIRGASTSTCCPTVQALRRKFPDTGEIGVSCFAAYLDGKKFRLTLPLAEQVGDRPDGGFEPGFYILEESKP